MKDMSEILDEIGLPEEYQAIVMEVEVIARRILSYIPRGIKDYPEHGVVHSENLLLLFKNFLNNFSKSDLNFHFTYSEKLLICLSIWLHDIGCIFGRERHSENSVKLLEEIDEFKHLKNRIGASLFECLKYIIISHSSWYDFSKLPRNTIDPGVDLLKTCAVFRLLDACDLSSERVKVIYDILKKYGLLNQKSRIYWEAHLNIISVVFDNDVIIINCRNKESTEQLIKHFEEELESVNSIFCEIGMPKLKLHVVVEDFL